MNKEIWFVDSNGKRRKGIEKSCPQCKCEFITRKPTKGWNQIFCSRECRTSYDRQGSTVNCWECGKSVYRKLSYLKRSRNNVFFCSRECKDKAQSYESNCTIIQPPHYHTGKASYRSIAFRNYEHCCAVCKYSYCRSLHVHHIDKNRNNNNISNLIILCSNHHGEVHGGLFTLEQIRYLQPRSTKST